MEWDGDVDSAIKIKKLLLTVLTERDVSVIISFINSQGRL
jgi:hypothetical protein